MVNINDTIEIHDGVTILVGRHDSAMGDNLNGKGAAYSYIMGKFAPEYFRVDPPQHIYYSAKIESVQDQASGEATEVILPVVRTRNTAKMHRIAQGVQTGEFADLSYDVRLRETAGDEERKQAVIDAVKDAQKMGYKTIELITHSDNPISVAHDLGCSVAGSMSYGGMVAIKADNWDDMLDPSVRKQVSFVTGSVELAQAVLGQTQVEILDYMLNPKGSIRDTEMGKNPEIQKIWQSALGTTEPYDAEQALNAVILAKRRETAKWALMAIQGEEVDSVVRPDEFMEAFDAYKFWIQGAAAALDIATPLHKDDPLNSELMNKLLALDKKSRTLPEILSDDGVAVHPLFHAYASRVEGDKMTARKAAIKSKVGTYGLEVPGYADVMDVAPQKATKESKEESHSTEDHPLLYAMLAAKMAKEKKEK